MGHVELCESPSQCRDLWEQYWPKRCLFDLWQVRECFAAGYNRQPCFLVFRQGRSIEGMLALSWVDEEHCFMHYPGETWQGKTWLEQNTIPARSMDVCSELLQSVPAATHLRYLNHDAVPLSGELLTEDEVGYLFFPGRYDYSYPSYLNTFSGKSKKKLARELASLEQHGVSYRYNRVADLRWLYQTNLEYFQDQSYFYDPRFLDSMERLVAWLHQKDMLRITTILLGGTVAAVDIGALWKGTYTILAGATNPLFPGIAKMINFHHLEWSCEQRFDVVDFLCGDFSWKKRFHLSPRPLYKISLYPNKCLSSLEEARQGAVCGQ